MDMASNLETCFAEYSLQLQFGCQVVAFPSLPSLSRWHIVYPVGRGGANWPHNLSVCCDARFQAVV